MLHKLRPLLEMRDGMVTKENGERREKGSGAATKKGRVKQGLLGFLYYGDKKKMKT